MSRSLVETIIGAVVIIFCIFFAHFIYNKGGVADSASSDSYILSIKFQRIDGIQKGSLVKVSGVTAGKVLDCRLNGDYSVNINVSLKRSITLPIDTTAEVISSSLMGDKYVSLIPGIEEVSLRDGDTIGHTRSPLILENVLSSIVFKPTSDKP